MVPPVVIFDFYGTLAHNVEPFSMHDVLAEHGYVLPAETADQWWNGDLDGMEHLEPSKSRDAYRTWQEERTRDLLRAVPVRGDDVETVLATLDARRRRRKLRPYPETHDALDALRSAGATLAVCSNWDWDLEPALAEAGLAGRFDVVVSSAWVGARKPHPRIFEETLARLDTAPDSVAFVGDTWGPDVEGPLAAGMTPVYLERSGHWPDPSRPGAPNRDITTITHLGELTDGLERTATQQRPAPEGAARNQTS